MILPGVTFFIALSASVKNAVNPAPPPPPPPSFGTTTVLKVVNSVRNLDIAVLVGLKSPPPPPPPPQSFGAVFAQVWEDPLSFVPSSSDLVGVADHVYHTWEAVTIPSTSDIVAALGDIRHVKFADIRQRFQAPPPPPPSSFLSKAWFREAFKLHAERPPPPPSPFSWAWFCSLIDFGAVITKVYGTPPPPPLSQWAIFTGEIQGRYTTTIAPHMSYLAFILGKLRSKVICIPQGFRSIIGPAAVNATILATPIPSSFTSNSTASPFSWLESIHMPSSGALSEIRNTLTNAANSALSSIWANNFCMNIFESFYARVADLAGTSISMRLFPVPVLMGGKVDLSTSDIPREPTYSTRDPSFKVLIQAPHLIKEKISNLRLIQTGLCNTIFGVGYALGYTHAFLNDSDVFSASRIYKWMQFFAITALFFVFLFLWNRCVDYWVQLSAEKRLAEEEEKRLKENPPRADSLIYYWTRYTPAQEQAILDGVQ
ncbi:hypothetical protein BDZ94DRAFT_1255355 [Collybia nuda]|uniref:Uncharacterized protein n=1 Tax=Collybia nuda TaxID=64659 RepID=A0A9P5Y779_9AGAR|nr:hypothetical protein BDZ94DRAFT_1255355 [Collybia nuda]